MRRAVAAAAARWRRRAAAAVRNGACTLCIDVIFASLYEWPPASSSRGIHPVAATPGDGRP